MSEAQTVYIELSVDDVGEHERLMSLLREVIDTPESGVIRLRDATDRSSLGALETIFAIGMTIGVLVPSSALGVWLLAHQKGGNDPVSSSSQEGKTLIKALTEPAKTEESSDEDAAKAKDDPVEH